MSDDAALVAASPAETLESFRVHLFPSPRPGNLPTILNFFAYLTLIAENVRDEASNCLLVNESPGDYQDMLSGPDKSDLILCAERDLDYMRRLSLRVRGEHLRLVCSKVTNFVRVRELLENYFPEYTEGQEDDHEMMFIRYDSDDDIPRRVKYRAEVENCLDAVKEAHALQRPAPKMRQVCSLETAKHEMWRYAERTVKDAEKLESVFDGVRKRRREETSLPPPSPQFNHGEKRRKLSMR